MRHTVDRRMVCRFKPIDSDVALDHIPARARPTGRATQRARTPPSRDAQAAILPRAWKVTVAVSDSELEALACRCLTRSGIEPRTASAAAAQMETKGAGRPPPAYTSNRRLCAVSDGSESVLPSFTPSLPSSLPLSLPLSHGERRFRTGNGSGSS